MKSLAVEPSFWHLDATGWAAVTGIGTVGLAAIALGTAIYAARQFREAAATRREARAAAREAARAYVVAEFARHHDVDFVLEFIVRNTGRTAARDVRFRWDPEPVRAVKGQTPFMEAELFKGIATLAPGREIKIFFDSTLDRYPEGASKPRLPGRHTLVVEYTDIFGQEHSDLFVLDADVYRYAHFVSTATIDDVGKALKRIADTLHASNMGAGRFRVQTQTVDEARREESARWEARRKAFEADASDQAPEGRGAGDEVSPEYQEPEIEGSQ